VCFIAHLDRWMQAADVALGELSGPAVERYLAERRTVGYVEYRSIKALRPLLDFLAPLGMLPAPQEVPPRPMEDLLARYGDYLLGERSLTDGTVRGYVDCVRPFVASRLRGDVLDLTGVSAADVTAFVLAPAPAALSGRRS
jgi:integrase/recombinase XerD